MPEMLTYENWDEEKACRLLEKQNDYFAVLKWAFQEYQDQIVYACSFGAEGIVLIDLIYKLNKRAKIIFLDTGVHFPETYELIEKMKKRYPLLDIISVPLNASLENKAHGCEEELWNHDPHLCCHLRKVVPMETALKNAKAWISGLRREQSPGRSQTQYINKDAKFQKVKICPLIHWTWQEIMSYIHLNHLPYNPLHDQGYLSIGCAPCTKPVSDGGEFREGRWAGQTKTECGLHQT